MRLWHKDLIHYLPRQQLVGQWRELCLIAKNIDEKKTPNHVLVNRVLDYPSEDLFTYGMAVAAEMKKRGYRTKLDSMKDFTAHLLNYDKDACQYLEMDFVFFDWHTVRYLRQCLFNLQEKADCGAIPPEEWKRIENHFKEYLK